MNQPIDLPVERRKFLPTLQRHEPSVKDSTAVKSFKACPRKYFYRFVLGRQKPEGEMASVFAWGTAVHKFLEVLYESGDVADAMTQGLKLYKAPTSKKFDFQTKERFIAMCTKLYNMYKEENGKGLIKVEGIEQPFSMRFPDGNDVGGRYDQIVKWNERSWIRDWKTTSKQLNYWKKGIEPNDQATRYIYAASCFQYGQNEQGYPNKVIEGVIFTVIYNAKTVDNVIENVPSSRNMFQLKKWVDDQLMIHRQMDMCREADVWPQNEDNCSWCDFQIVCNSPSEGAMKDLLTTQYVLKPWHHEEVDQKEIAET
jgi:hypothetical protein